MKFENLNKQQKALIFFVLPGLLLIIVIAANIIFAHPEQENTEESSSYQSINTSLPSTSSAIQITKISAYKNQYKYETPERTNSDFILGEYQIIQESNQDSIPEKKDEINKKISQTGETLVTNSSLKEVRKKLIVEQNAIESCNKNEVYDSEKIHKIKEKKKSASPKKNVQILIPSDKIEKPANKSISFHSISLKKEKIHNTTDGIPAFIHGNQTVTHGSYVKIRTGKDIYLPNGNKIPINTFLYGSCSFVGERVNIKIIKAQIGDKNISCNLTGYGTDGNLGIHVQGSVQREENKKSSGKGLKKIGSVLGNGINVASGGVLGGLAETATEGVIDAITDGTAKSIQQTKAFLPNNEPIFLK